MVATVARKGARRAGFTLIELVVVILILAVLAGLVVPIVGWLRRSANYASAANNQNTVMANFELFRTTFGNNSYPDRLDSLLDAGGTPPAYLDSGLTGMFTPTALTQDQFDCLNNSGRGIRTIMHHEPTPFSSLVLEGNPGNTGTIPHTLAVGSQVALVNMTLTGNTNAAQLTRSLYPDGIPTEVNLVLFGVGPSNSAVGKTMQSPPFDTNVDTSEVYNRFITVFAVYSPREGRRAQLKAVLDPRGRILNRQLSEFHQSTNPD